jgi:hypothetical protein
MVLPLGADVALAADKRVALVVGNSAYQNVAKLPNPVNDATSIGNMFRNAGFDVVDAKFDLGSLNFKRAIREFTYQARDADIAVVYYAGHGIEVGGINYLIPVDAKLATDLDAEDEGVSLDRVIRAIEPARRLRLVILDACRDNPFNQKMQRTMAMRAVTNGLAKIELTLSDTMIAYAAKAGSTAEDGNGGNSPFTSALLKHLTEPGLDVRIAFGRVRDEVWSKTGHRQEPFVYASLGGSEVPLVPVARKVEPAPPPASAENEVRRAYELTAQVATKEAWEAFLKDYKAGLYADLARVQLAKLTAPAPAQPDVNRQVAEADRAWDKLKDSNDRVAIRKFIELFPASVHVPNAQHRLEVLEQAAQDRDVAARAEREAVRLREEAAQRAKAAEADKQQQEREAAKRREEEAQRAKAAMAEKQRQEREVAKRREEEERLAKATEAERQRVEREIAKRREEEERLAKAREADRQRQERETAKRREDEERRVQEAALRLEQTCKRDEASLARLKTAGVKAQGDVARLEKDLGCERLRPDVVALREQLNAQAAKEAPVQAPVANTGEDDRDEPSARHGKVHRPATSSQKPAKHERREASKPDRQDHEHRNATPHAPPPRATSQATAGPRPAASHGGMMIGY